jgi:hypothetical protein
MANCCLKKKPLTLIDVVIVVIAAIAGNCPPSQYWITLALTAIGLASKAARHQSLLTNH